MLWYYNGSSTKSYADVNKLIHNIIRHKDPKASNFSASFSTAHEAERMDKSQPSKSSAKSKKSGPLPFKSEDGWIQGSVSITIPCDGFVSKSEEDAPWFVVDRIWYRKPLEVVKLAFSEPVAEKFHITPFKEYWKRNYQKMNLKKEYTWRHLQQMLSMKIMRLCAHLVGKVQTGS